MEDELIIEKIQEDNPNPKYINELISRHSGIYLDMVNSLCDKKIYPITYSDFISDKDLNIYISAKKFDKTKGAKFSTFLGNRTRWMCLNEFNKSKRQINPINTDIIENIPEHPSFDSIQDAIKKDTFNKILNIINQHPDSRVEKIFKLRYITCEGNKVTPWKNICGKVNLSIQGCINVHNTAINYIQKNLTNQI